MAASKPIGKGVVIFMDIEEVSPCQLRSSCLNGSETPETTYTFTFNPDDDLSVGDPVLFVVKGGTDAENVVKIPATGSCL